MYLFEKIISNKIGKYKLFTYEQGNIIYKEKDLCDRIGIIIEGKLTLVHHSFTGKEIVLGTLQRGDLFGDFLIFSSNPYYPGDLMSKQTSKVLFIPKEKLINELKEDFDFQYFYYSQLSEKALKLNIHNKILNLSSLREKIIVYLEINSSKLEKRKVYIPSKTEFASYLNIQRPSLSRELKSMKEDKIIDFDKKHIWLLKP